MLGECAGLDSFAMCPSYVPGTLWSQRRARQSLETMSLLVAHQQRCEVFSGEAAQPPAGLGRGSLGRLKGPHEVQAGWVGRLRAIGAKGRFAGRAGGLSCSESGCGVSAASFLTSVSQGLW